MICTWKYSSFHVSIVFSHSSCITTLVCVQPPLFLHNRGPWQTTHDEKESLCITSLHRTESGPSGSIVGRLKWVPGSREEIDIWVMLATALLPPCEELNKILWVSRLAVTRGRKLRGFLIWLNRLRRLQQPLSRVHNISAYILLRLLPEAINCLNQAIDIYTDMVRAPPRSFVCSVTVVLISE